MEKRNLFYPVGETEMKNKNYSLNALTVAYTEGYLIEDDGSVYRVFDEKQYIIALKEILHLSKYKCKVVIDTFVDLGIMKKCNGELWLNPVKNNFLKLNISTAVFCLNTLSDFSFKLYCFLKNKQAIHNSYKLNEMYYFSDKELLEHFGYSRKYENTQKLNQSLNVLESLGLISYEHEYHGRPGCSGVYRGLKNVSNVSPIQLEGDRQTQQYYLLEQKMDEGLLLNS